MTTAQQHSRNTLLQLSTFAILQSFVVNTT